MPSRAIPAIIGAKGVKAQEITELSGARFDVDRTNECITLKGSHESCLKLKELIEEILENEGFNVKDEVFDVPMKLAATAVTVSNIPITNVIPTSTSRVYEPPISKSANRRKRRKEQDRLDELNGVKTEKDKKDERDRKVETHIQVGVSSHSVEENDEDEEEDDEEINVEENQIEKTVVESNQQNLTSITPTDFVSISSSLSETSPNSDTDLTEKSSNLSVYTDFPKSVHSPSQAFISSPLNLGIIGRSSSVSVNNSPLPNKLGKSQASPTLGGFQNQNINQNLNQSNHNHFSPVLSRTVSIDEANDSVGEYNYFKGNFLQIPQMNEVKNEIPIIVKEKFGSSEDPVPKIPELVPPSSLALQVIPMNQIKSNEKDGEMKMKIEIQKTRTQTQPQTQTNTQRQLQTQTQTTSPGLGLLDMLLGYTSSKQILTTASTPSSMSASTSLEETNMEVLQRKKDKIAADRISLELSMATLMATDTRAKTVTATPTPTVSTGIVQVPADNQKQLGYYKSKSGFSVRL